MYTSVNRVTTVLVVTVRGQAIMQIYAGLLSVVPLRTDFCEIKIKYVFPNVYCKIQSLCLEVNGLVSNQTC